jgi:ribonuclease HI
MKDGAARPAGTRPGRRRRTPRPAPDLLAHIDGGARGNPGPAGYGVHLTSVDGDPVADLYGYLGIATNNIAEYAALLALLEHVLTLSPARLTIRSDSELLIRQMRGEYRVKDPKLRILHLEALRLLGSLPAITFEHVRRENNREADALANRAMDERAGTGPLPAALRLLPAIATQSRLPNL